MSHLNLQSPQISLELPAAELARDPDRRRSVAPAGADEPDEHGDELSAARGMLIALGLSACMWIIVLTAIAFF